MTFYSVGNVIIPTDGVIFFKGVGQPPTSIYIYTQDCDLPISWAKRWKCPLLISAQTRFVGVPVDDCDDHWTPLKVVFPEVGSRATFFLATMQVSYLGMFFSKVFQLDKLGPAWTDPFLWAPSWQPGFQQKGLMRQNRILAPQRWECG